MYGRVRISTHTLRGERDYTGGAVEKGCTVISTHTLRGERDLTVYIRTCLIKSFQLTRSVGSVTQSKSN